MTEERRYIPAIRPDIQELCSALSRYENPVDYFHLLNMYSGVIDGDGIESSDFDLTILLEINVLKCLTFKLSFAIWGIIDGGW